MANTPFQVSSKMPDGRIFVVAADTYEQFEESLSSVVGLEDAQSLLTIMAGSLMGAATSVPQAAGMLAQGLGATPVNAPTQTFTPSGSPTSKVCKHGEMSKRTGQGAKGPWKAYMCPSPKGTVDQCEPIWVRRNDADWNSF